MLRAVRAALPSPASAAGFDLYRAMSASRAQPLRQAALGPEGAWIVHWRNAETEALYEQPAHHTLSLYLEGGEAVRCLDQPSARGAPGRLCCMPAGHRSRWAVHGSLQLLHLYLPQLPLALAAEQWFDRDPRLAHLHDRIYFDDAELARLGRAMVALDWDEADAGLALQALGVALQARLLQVQGHVRQDSGARWRGGLSPPARRRVLACIEAALATPGEALDLATLAQAACLSSFHFARMFRQSFGMAPHAWVMQRRLARARELLADPRLPLAEVAARAGYAHLGHLNRALQRAGLGSGGRYRAALDRVSPAAAG